MYIIRNPIKIPDDCGIIVEGINYAGVTTHDSQWTHSGTLDLTVSYSESHSHGKDPLGDNIGSFGCGLKPIHLTLEQTTKLKEALRLTSIKQKEDQVDKLIDEIKQLRVSTN